MLMTTQSANHARLRSSGCEGRRGKRQHCRSRTNLTVKVREAGEQEPACSPRTNLTVKVREAGEQEPACSPRTNLTVKVRGAGEEEPACSPHTNLTVKVRGAGEEGPARRLSTDRIAEVRGGVRHLCMALRPTRRVTAGYSSRADGADGAIPRADWTGASVVQEAVFTIGVPLLARPGADSPQEPLRVTR